MMAHRIFLSGTCKDLEAERNVLRDVCNRIGITVHCQRLFGASWKSPIAVIKENMSSDDCDLYLLVVGFRYGSLVPAEEVLPALAGSSGSRISYTELEFNLAYVLGLRRLIYLKAGAPEAISDVDQDQADRRERFIRKIQSSGCTTYKFRDTHDLAVQAAIDIMKALSDFDVKEAVLGRDYEL